jgi:tetratricopeptide (TPR) repeat protein
MGFMRDLTGKALGTVVESIVGGLGRGIGVEFIGKTAGNTVENWISKSGNGGASYSAGVTNSTYIVDPFKLGKQYLEAEEYEQAIEFFCDLLQEDPENAAAMFHLGLAYHRSGNFEDALSYYNDSIELGSDYDGSAYFNMGIIYNYVDEYHNIMKADEYFDKAIELIPDYENDIIRIREERKNISESENDEATDLIEKGRQHIEAEEYEQAVELFSGILQEDPENAAAMFHLGLSYHRSGNFEDALDHYDDSVTVGSDNDGAAYFNMGAIYNYVDEYLDIRKADVYFNKAIKLIPDYENDVIRIRKEREDIIKFEKGVFADLFKRGEQHIEAEEYEQAIELFSSILQKDPENAIAMFHLGYAYQENKQFKEALSNYNDSVTVGSAFDGSIYLYMGLIYNYVDEYLDIRKADIYFNKAIILIPDYENDVIKIRKERNNK